MPSLVLGPLLRHVDKVSATIWVETQAACRVSVTEPSDTGSRPLGEADTFHVRDHHFALVFVEGLEPGSATPYEVRLDGEVVWPLADSTRPPSRIRTPGGPGAFSVVFGSCRYATPLVISSEDNQEFPPDALDTYSVKIARLPSEQWPDALVLLGDQVYADETAEETKKYLASRRDLSKPPHDQLANFEEFTYIYRQSWTDPDIRWLLSTIPSSMIFDDHDVIDDWNTSGAWRADIESTDWWADRIAGALGSYWIYQHIGNLSPDELRADPNFARITGAPDGYEALREMALEADRNPGSIRWSYLRKWHTVRLLMIDSRAARSLKEGSRAMLDDEEFSWVEEKLMEAGTEEIEHVLVGSSLPWLMPPAIHDLEGWNAELVRRFEGRRIGRVSEKFRQAGDLEHWAAFRDSFDRLGAALESLGRGEHGRPPRSLLVLSGDVHHAYVAEVVEPRDITSRIYQLTCSPVHNEVPHPMVQAFKIGWSKPAIALSAGLRRLARVPRTRLRWSKRSGPFFGNELAVLTLDAERAQLQFEKAEHGADGNPLLRTVFDGRLS
ncbi:MAG: alkaline phosphatase family protein [Actinomycetota bacterium]|nr:alkaline phosphatase family protein [Actinomycetota bacterium]